MDRPCARVAAVGTLVRPGRLGAADADGAICRGRAHGTDRGHLSAGFEPDRRPRNVGGYATGPGVAAPAAQAACYGVGLQLSVRGAALGVGAGNPGALRETLRFAVDGVCA